MSFVDAATPRCWCYLDRHPACAGEDRLGAQKLLAAPTRPKLEMKLVK